MIPLKKAPYFNNKIYFYIFIWAALPGVFFAVYNEYHGGFLLGDGVVLDNLALNVARQGEFKVTEEIFENLEKEPPIRQSMLRDWQRKGCIWDTILIGEPTAFIEPMFPLFAGYVYRSAFAFRIPANFRFFILRIAHSFLHAGSCLLIFFLALKIFQNSLLNFPKITAIIAALIVSVYPFLVYYTSSISTETLFIFLFLLNLALFFHFRPNFKIWNIFVLGIILGLCFLTRTIGIILLPVYIISFIFDGLLKESKGSFSLFQRSFIFTFFLLIGFAFTVSPWVYRNWLVWEKVIVFPTKGGRNLWEMYSEKFSSKFNETASIKDIGTYSELRKKYLPQLKCPELTSAPEFLDQPEWLRNEILTKQVLTFIKSNPTLGVELYWLHLKELFRILPLGQHWRSLSFWSLISTAWILPLAFIGFIFSFRDWRRFYPLYLVILAYISAQSLVAGGITYRLPLDSLFIMFAGFIISWLLQNLLTFRKKQP